MCDVWRCSSLAVMHHVVPNIMLKHVHTRTCTSEPSRLKCSGDWLPSSYCFADDFRSCIPRLVQLNFRFDSSCLLFKFADFIFLHVGASGIGNDTIEGLSLAVAVWGMLATNL